MNLLNAAINSGVQTFVFTSSIAVYGSTLSSDERR
jgi:nucleoside-diphosphate-sugar epimerase